MNKQKKIFESLVEMIQLDQIQQAEIIFNAYVKLCKENNDTDLNKIKEHNKLEIEAFVCLLEASKDDFDSSMYEQIYNASMKNNWTKVDLLLGSIRLDSYTSKIFELYDTCPKE
jgi:hypothetical protein